MLQLSPKTPSILLWSRRYSSNWEQKQVWKIGIWSIWAFTAIERRHLQMLQLYRTIWWTKGGWVDWKIKEGQKRIGNPKCGHWTYAKVDMQTRRWWRQSAGIGYLDKSRHIFSHCEGRNKCENLIRILVGWYFIRILSVFLTPELGGRMQVGKKELAGLLVGGDA